MHTKTTTVQKLPREYERKIIEFHKYVINMRKKLRFEIGQLGNMVEDRRSSNCPSVRLSGFWEQTSHTIFLWLIPLLKSDGPWCGSNLTR